MNRFLPQVACIALACTAQLSAKDQTAAPEQSEYYSPIPPVVSAPAGQPPSDAIVLFSGENLNAWQSRAGGPVKWKLAGGTLTVQAGTGDIATKRSFGDLQLHLEFREPADVSVDGQGRGNSGVFFMGRYELQVLDNYNNPTYVNGQVGSLYKQYPPLVNAARPPGEWQTYDCVWIAPRFAADSSRVGSPARLTVFHNGVLVQYNIPVKGPTEYRGLPKYEKHADKLPLVLQEHHDVVSYRNIWIRELNLPNYSIAGTVAAPPNVSGSVLITVTPAGSVLLNNRPVTGAELKKGLAEIHQKAPQIPVIILARDAQNIQAAKIFAACKEAGLTNLSRQPAD